jgi:spore coat polysaccharide biosynthesis protein SpsF
MKDMLLEYKRLRSTGQPLDYLSNGLHRTYPRGLDTEIFSIDALEDAWKNAHLDYQREHVTPYIYEQPKQFFLRNYASTSDWSQYRWTLDTPEDWKVISAMYRDLYDPAQEYFSTEQALAWVRDHAAEAMINAHIPQKPIAIQ